MTFVAEVKTQCGAMDAQYEERTKTRAEETEAISKAVEILDAEEAHASFAKSFSFLQESHKSPPALCARPPAWPRPRILAW
ncbi:unnamed protein product [Effrenium voratum]|uniref:Uncharacterized protein n=1 Tax=Effrenium voratum TaxID=2562239 RepID=A0AA36J2E4_9DINO|nr:unnamed protein product [Effrenium voratum]